MEMWDVLLLSNLRSDIEIIDFNMLSVSINVW